MKWMISALVVFSLLNVGWDVLLYINPDKQTIANYTFNFVDGFIYYFAAFIAFLGTLKYGLRSMLGKSLACFTVAFIAFATGLYSWGFYNVVFQTPVPFPGIPDLFFLLFNPFSIVGFMLFIYHLGGRFTWLRLLELVVVFGLLFFLLYVLLNQFGLGDDLPLLTKILNITYPALDAFMVALAVVAIRTEKGFFHPNLLLFAFAYLFLAAADTIFAYRSSLEIYWNGDISDTFYMIAAVIFAVAILTTLSQTKHEVHARKFLLT